MNPDLKYSLSIIFVQSSFKIMETLRNGRKGKRRVGHCASKNKESETPGCIENYDVVPCNRNILYYRVSSGNVIGHRLKLLIENVHIK